MTTTDDVTTQSPGILMIEGREHVLYQGFLERIRIANARLLWLNTASVWFVALFTILTAIDIAHPDSSWWIYIAALAAIVSSVAFSLFMESRDVLSTPFAVVERDRAGGSSTLVITSRPQRGFSTRPTVVRFATVHPEMADFLRTAFSGGQSRRYRQRPRVPVEFRTSRARRQAWASNVALPVTLLALASIAISVATR